jgi:hypothetical protein
VAALRRAACVRERCGRLLAFVEAEGSRHWRVQREALPAVAERVAALARTRFPTLAVPLHARRRHVEAGAHGAARVAALDAAVARAAGPAASAVEAMLISVLLDAGAGAAWRFTEPGTGEVFARSEGLAVAVHHAFLAGRFSGDTRDPCRVDAAGLGAIDAPALGGVFQATAANPLVGLEGRVELLRRLARVLAADPLRFGHEARPGRLFASLAKDSPGAGLALPAADLLTALLDAFSAIWPGGTHLGTTPLGDVWPHAAAGGEGASAGLVPFHKLSQWLAYSLVEPLAAAGLHVTALDGLTGLPEYRNGGLFIDAGVIEPREAALLVRTHAVADEAIVEWRACTVALLDELAPLVRERLGPEASAMTLPQVLEAGTWAAGRAIAAERRAGGAPPIAIASDGTVF